MSGSRLILRGCLPSLVRLVKMRRQACSVNVNREHTLLSGVFVFHCEPTPVKAYERVGTLMYSSG